MTAPTFDQAVQDRLGGRLDKAIAEFRALAESRPADADVWLNLGLALTAKGDLKGAEAALAKGLQIAPDYPDLQVAYARLAFFHQHPAEARRRLQPALSGPPNADAQDLLKQIVAAEREAATLPWRVDAGFSYSSLSRGIAPWREWDLSAGRRIDSLSGLALGVEQTDRFGVSNTYLHGEYSRRFGAWGAFAGYGGSPNAVYRARNFVQGGLTSPAAKLGYGWSLAGELDASYGDYVSGGVTSVQPALTLASGEVFSLSGRYVHTINELRQTLSGYILRAEISPARRWRLSAGFADAPDSSSGVTIKVHTWSGGVALDLNDATTLRLSGAHETGRIYTRDDYAASVTRRF